ncbi:VIT domain-containing protein [Fluviicola sp.]|uniref:VIT domain-containing protein n=1 Tax=Fluviicola sp. TaxID=1917219 RepID=UPI0031D36758
MKKYLAPALAVLFGGSFILYGILTDYPSVERETKSYKKASWSNEKPVVDTTRMSPALLVKNKKEVSIPLRTKRLHIQTAIHGTYAETTLEIEFQNDNDRVLEGEFYFPLSEKQLISEFRLEVNGEMREGVVVDKDLGRVAFESTVRRKVDPGLLEWSKGNTFKARVYPIPAKGTKKVMISYVEELTTNGGANAYYLPLNYKGIIDQFTYEIAIDDQGQKIEDKRNEYRLIGNRFVTASEWNKKSVKDGIQIVQRNLDASESVLAASADGGYILQTSLQPALEKKLKPALKSVSILLDVSASSGKRDFEKEKSLIYDYLSAHKKTDVQLIAFSNEVHFTSRRTILSTSDLNALLNEMDGQKLDGGTQLGCVDGDQISGEEVLLLSDCLSNLGEEAFPKLDKKRVYVISSAPEFDSRAAKLTVQNGGEFINLAELGLKESLEKLKYEQLHFLGLEGDKGITTGIGAAAGSDFISYSKFKTLPEELTLLFGTGGKTKKRLTLKSASLRKTASPQTLAKFWSDDYLKELDLEGAKNKAKMLRLAKENKLISPYTSLIVLDELEDYVQYRIVPPAKLRKAYYKRLAELPKAEKKSARVETKEHREAVLSRFGELIKWWETDFEQMKAKAEKKLEEEQELAVRFVEPVTVAEGTYMVLADETSGSTTYAFSGSVSANSVSYTTNATTAVYKQEQEGSEGKIELSNWDPKTPYLSKLKASRAPDAYNTYLELKKEYQNQPSFYVDVSDYFLKIGKKKEAIRVLSNIAELEMENPQMLRILAHRYAQIEAFDLAVSVFEGVKKMRPEEPQSYRDLALVYELNKQYYKAFRELKYVITHNWDERFRDIENICLVELNHLVAKHKLHSGKLNQKLIRELPVDVRVVIDWDSDNCDIDLWVTDPTGEKCFYSNQQTKIGGRISFDCTGGYGPEEFMIKKALKGRYKVQANYYGSSAQTLSGLTTIQVKLITNYGRPNEKMRSITRRLEEQKAVIDLAEFDFN